MMSIYKSLYAIAIVILASTANARSHELLQPERKVVGPTEYGFAHANVVTSASPMLYISGQVGISETGKNDFYTQVDRSFERLEAVLKQSGAKVEDVVKITLLIADFGPDKLAYMVKKRKSFFGKKSPASTLIPVTRLYTDGVKFEIDAIAMLPN